MEKEYRSRVYQIRTADGFEWCADFPDVEGVIGGGSTPEEAVAEAYENLGAHLAFLEEAGEELPKPTIQIDDSYSGKFQLRVSKSLHKKAAMVADEEGISLNTLVVEALTNRVTDAGNLKMVGKLREVVTELGNDLMSSQNYIQQVMNLRNGGNYGQQGYSKDSYKWPTYSAFKCQIQ